MATASCPNNNCIALARWPMGDPVEKNPGGSAAARKRGSSAAAVVEAQDPESFAVVASPTVMAGDDVPFNRVILVVNARTEGRALKAYRAQLENALKTIDEALKQGQPSVEVMLKVPDDLTRPRRLLSAGTATGMEGTTKTKTKTNTKTKTKPKTGKKDKKAKK